MSVVAPHLMVRPRWQRIAPPGLIIAGLGAATLALHVRDPHVAGSWGACPSLTLFGIYCPACGGLRAVNDLTNLDILGAAHSHLLFVACVPFIVFYLGRWLVDAWQGRQRMASLLHHASVWWVLLGTLAVFTVWRNLPTGGWLHP